MVAVSASKALVRHVKEREVALLQHQTGDLPPLLGCGVNTSGVVGAGVQQEDAPAGRFVDVLQKALQVQTPGGGLVVAVDALGHTCILPDVVVVGPGGVGDVHLAAGHEAGLELGHEAARAGARQRLHRGHMALAHGLGIVTVCELHRLGHKVLQPSNGEVLHKMASSHPPLGLTHRGQHHWAALVITVGTHAQVHLLGGIVCQKLLRDTQNWVLWGLRYVSEPCRPLGRCSRCLQAAGREPHPLEEGE
mmetsp:Transcript_26998/g.59033  ORF Transcript_26998/g.59033 Transcript_26998/m.59033 type:complete len:249 (-) Transcript_26998:49-795(-)